MIYASLCLGMKNIRLSVICVLARGALLHQNRALIDVHAS